MIAINLIQAERTRTALESCEKQLTRLLAETEQVQAGLRGMSGLEEALWKLNRQKEVLQEEITAARQMEAGLSMGMELYGRRELQLAEYAEEVRAVAGTGTKFRVWETPKWLFTLLK